MDSSNKKFVQLHHNAVPNEGDVPEECKALKFSVQLWVILHSANLHGYSMHPHSEALTVTYPEYLYAKAAAKLGVIPAEAVINLRNQENAFCE